MIKTSSSTTDKDLGEKALLEQLRLADGAFVETGLFEGETHPESEATLAQIGAANEFGTRDGRIPPRPFLSRAVREKGESWRRWLEDGYDRILRAKGKIRVFDVLVAFGELAASDVRRTIDSVLSPPKAESTIRREGGPLRRTKTGKVAKGAREHQRRFTHPLIWLGYMRAAVRSRVTVSGTHPKMTAKGTRSSA